MRIVNVVDTLGRTVDVDMDTAKLHSYSNRDKQIVMNVQMIEDGEPSRFWTDITVEGTVDSVEERCRQFNNPLRFAYAKMMDFNSSENDPDEKVWSMLMDWARENQEKLFDKYGDWKKVIIANPSKGILEVVKNARGGAREGAGRKPSEVKKSTWSVKVTEEEKQLLKKHLEEIRESK